MNRTARRIYETIQQTRGLNHIGVIAHLTGYKLKTCQSYVDSLMEFGLISAEILDGKVSYYIDK